MLRMEAKTKLSPEQAVKKALEFFGPKGLGMNVKEETPTCVYLEGGGGEVQVTACEEGKVTKLELVSREWDNQLKKFARRVAS